jgi:hypothetical protein
VIDEKDKSERDVKDFMEASGESDGLIALL